MAEPTEDRALQQLRDEVAHKAYMSISLCSIDNNDTIAPHWKLFNPISELIQASVTDEKTIPYFLSRIDDKVREMRRQLDTSNLNDIITCNVLQMFAGFVKFSKTTPTAAATISDAHAEIERLKGELFNKTTEFERQKQLIEKYEGFKQNMFNLMRSFDGTFDAGSLNLLPINQAPPTTVRAVVPVVPVVATRAGRAATPAAAVATTKRQQKKSTQLVRRVVETDANQPARSHGSQLVLQSSDPPIAAMPVQPILSSTSIHSIVHPATPRLDGMNTDQFLDAVLGPDWRVHAMEEEEEEPPVQRKKRAVEDIMAELAGEVREEEVVEPKRTRTGRAVNYAASGQERAEESEGGAHRCPFYDCDRTFQKIPTMVDHTTNDHYWIGALQLQCSECSELCESERAFETHLLNCPFGRLVFTVSRWDPEETEEEAATRPLREKRLLKCPFAGCNYSTKQRSRGIFKHISKQHKDEGKASYRCECGKTRRTINTILFHHYQECRDSEIDWFIDQPVNEDNDKTAPTEQPDERSIDDLVAILNGAED